VQAYAGSRALEAEYVRRALASIDRITPAGARDYALLFTYLQTGRRLSEVAALECRDLEELPGGKLRVTFRRCKGGKILHDTLTKRVSAALLAYLYIVHRLPMSQLAGNTPVWVSLAERNGTWGGRLSRVSISRICKARLGTTRVHTLRSTMAQVMEKQGAPVSLIQQRLAHSSLATTGIYLASLRQDDNPYADDIAGAFGAE
jgi:integrase